MGGLSVRTPPTDQTRRPMDFLTTRETTPPRHDGHSLRSGYRGKRVLDMSIAAVGFLPAGAMGAICAVGIRLEDGGPIFFHQMRIGLNGRPFTVWKLRTMTHKGSQNSLFPDPDRITVVGAVLRRFSLDELPQLINVVRGDMSIVGPRPTLPYQVARYDDRQRGRLAVRPGITGLAQLRGRNSITWAQRIEHDLEYCERQSLWLDVKIILRTAIAVTSGRGAIGHPPDDPLAASPGG